MRPLSYGIVAGCVALATGLGGESRAGTLTLSYTASITSNNLAYTPLGTGSGHVTPTAVTGSHAAVADSAPSLAPAGDVVGGITFTYSGGGLPNGYIVTGTVDLQITVKVGPDTGSFTLRETFANLVSSAGVPPAPALDVLGGGQIIGSHLVDINATGTGTMRNVPGLQVLVGFESAVIPEPGSIVLASIGFAGILLVRLVRLVRLRRRLTSNRP